MSVLKLNNYKSNAKHKALQHDLPDFLQIMAIFSETDIPTVTTPDLRLILPEVRPTNPDFQGGRNDE